MGASALAFSCQPKPTTLSYDDRKDSSVKGVCMPFQAYSKPFLRRNLEDQTMESICSRCFLTVAKATTSEEHTHEQAHICDGLKLQFLREQRTWTASSRPED
jgi:hypothetical protein